MLYAIIILAIVAIVGFIIGCNSCRLENIMAVVCITSFIMIIILSIVGCITGFINYPRTEGTQQGVITAVDLEGVWFRRYEVYLKSSGYTGEETVYKIYENETELAKELKANIGKEVRLNYGHNGGYIGAFSCGTYHIKSVENIEGSNTNEY
jgi:hypothetical protein